MRPDAEPEPLESVDENGAEAGELAGLTLVTPGLYLARGSSGAKRGEFTPGEYQINIHVPAGLPAGVLVMLYDQFGGFFINGTATLANLTTGTTSSSWTTNLYAYFDTPAAFYRIQAVADLQGYEPGCDPTRSSGVPGNPHSFFGNPREFGVDQFMRMQPGWSDDPNGGDGTVISFPFRAFASITGQALGINRQGVSGASVRLTGQTAGEVYDRHPWTTYGDAWITGAAGQFPDRLRLPPGRPFALLLQARGYAPWQASVPALPRGQVHNLGAIALTALDDNLNGIPDPWEFAHFNALVEAMADADGDGCPNLGEYQAGTDPTAAASVLRVATDAPPVTGGFQLRWLAVPDRSYRILAAESVASEWKVVDLIPSGETGLRVWTEPAPAGAARYFRIEPVAP
jgi:hypothetical protein